MIRRENIQTYTHATSDIAIQASEDPEAPEKEPAEEYDFNSPFLFSDMVLLVEDEKLHCHRAILSLYSPVFKAMFQSRFEETSANQVSLPKDDASTVRELLRHLYTPGGCDMDSAAAQRLLPLIHRFQIDSLISTAERTMTFSMTDVMAPKMLALADLYQLNHLKQAAIDACVRLDMKRMTEALEETPLSPELKATVFGNRVHLLEKALSDIERSFTQPCIRMESKLERVFTNHCQLHTRPLSHTTVPVNLRILNSTAAPSITAETVNNNNEPTNTASTTTATTQQQQPLIRPVIRGDDGRPIQQQSNLTTRVVQARSLASVSTDDARDVQEDATTTGGRSDENGDVTALVEVPAICESCVERISVHIKDICRRALHKATFVPYKPSPSQQ